MQNLTVFLIIVVAAGYVAWQLAPQILRRWLIRRLAAVAPSRRDWLARLEQSAGSSGCDSCEGCEGTGKARVPPTRPGKEVTIRVDS